MNATCRRLVSNNRDSYGSTMRSLMALTLLSSLACGDDSAAPDSGTPDVGAMDAGMDASSTAHWIDSQL